MDGYSDFVFLNNNGQVYTQSFVYDTIQGITTSYNKEEYAKALEEKREPCYLPKISAHILRHTFCTRMCEQNINIKVLQDVMGHRNIAVSIHYKFFLFRFPFPTLPLQSCLYFIEHRYFPETRFCFWSRYPITIVAIFPLLIKQGVRYMENIRTTMETYAKAFRDKKVEAVMALNGAFKIS